jgi:hypothetical protein
MPAGSSAVVNAPSGERSPGNFTQDASGCGRGGRFNIHGDRTLMRRLEHGSENPAAVPALRRHPRRRHRSHRCVPVSGLALEPQHTWEYVGDFRNLQTR